jgi:ubiquitin-protein ligase
MTSVCLARLRKEYRELQKKPVENVRAAPKETNLLEWHYVIEGPKGSPYEGGFYHGMVLFPKEYPYKPPSLQMFTPNGRFKVQILSNMFSRILIFLFCYICLTAKYPALLVYV